MRPFQINIPKQDIDDLQRRLHDIRLPGSIFRQGHEDGISVSFMNRLLTYWRDSYDWRKEEARLNQYPQFMTDVEGQEIHFLHIKGKGPNPRPLILTHGWPGCYTEFEDVILRLSDPAAFGGNDEDAFDLVIPSIPGYGFSPAPTKLGLGSKRVAQLWQPLMQQLGYDKFFTQGGDVGAGVSIWLALLYPENVEGVHLNFISPALQPPFGTDAPALTSDEQDFKDRLSKFIAEEGAYLTLQATKPQTLAFALADSPSGLAAWISEKFVSWAGHDGDLETVISLDKLLTIISIYWFGNNIDASLRIYKENRLAPIIVAEYARSNVPVSVAHFPQELPIIPPRTWVERGLNVVRWTQMPRGGHFAAMEQPDLFADDVRASFRGSDAD